MTNRELQNLSSNLERVAHLRGAKLSYAIVKNKRKIDEHLKDLSKVLEPDSEYNAYNEERMELCKKHADKDDDGNAIISDGKFQIEDMDAFNKEHEELAEKHREAVDRYEEKRKSYEEIMNEESDLELHTVPFDEVPDDITPEQMDIIEPMVDDGS